MSRLLLFAFLGCLLSVAAGTFYKYKCYNRAHPAHGHCYNYGYKAVFTCHSGYRLQGASVLYCRLGRWSGSAPTCVRAPIRCPRVYAPHNGHVHVSGNRATFQCHNGYRLDGPGTIYCLSGRWGETRPVCRKAALSCSLLQDPRNGRVTVSNGWARYVCDLGFWLEGNRERRCVNGRWIPSPAPSCRRSQNDRGNDSDSDDDSDDSSDDDSSDDDSGSDDSDSSRRGSGSSDSGSDSDSDSDSGSDRSRSRSRSRSKSRSKSRSRSRSKSRSKSRSRSRSRYGGSSDSDGGSSSDGGRRYGSGGSSGSDSGGHKYKYRSRHGGGSSGSDSD